MKLLLHFFFTFCFLSLPPLPILTAISSLILLSQNLTVFVSLSSLELTIQNHADFKLTDPCLPLPSKCWFKGICDHAQLISFLNSWNFVGSLALMGTTETL